MPAVCGYDTVVASREQADPPTGAAWSRASEVQFPDGRVHRGQSGVLAHHGVWLWDQLRDAEGTVVMSQIRVQVSIPKVLYGHNAVEVVDRSDVVRALEIVQGDVEEVLDECVNFESWKMQRVDVTLDRVLPDEDAVTEVLTRLAAVPMRGRLPVRGEDMSVSWVRGRGSYTRKAYSKWRESKRDEAKGRLRLEVQCNGHRAIRKTVGLRSDQMFTVESLIGEQGELLRERVGGVMETMVRPYVEGRPMDAWDVYQRLLKGGRASRAAKLLAYAYVIQRVGWKGLGQVVGSRQRLSEVRRALRDAGIDPLLVEFSAREDPRSVARDVSELVQDDEGDEDDQ